MGSPAGRSPMASARLSSRAARTPRAGRSKGGAAALIWTASIIQIVSDLLPAGGDLGSPRAPTLGGTADLAAGRHQLPADVLVHLPAQPRPLRPATGEVDLLRDLRGRRPHRLATGCHRHRAFAPRRRRRLDRQRPTGGQPPASSWATFTAGATRATPAMAISVPALRCGL